ncbi:hypothetical protein F2Q69_00006430 [Brassica cretica]|uniref:Uncharacterized protein n=1 Tax=Brassica cretica TaxID=69181 RepID=A0A8S9NZB9_BRACR|nr:hypothetical protein F2Q69_00006430 [Brassica cretica]
MMTIPYADSGFHESFAVETVIPSSNEDPTKEYDEDYWKERAIEITMHDDRYSSHSFNNTSPPSIDRVYSASVDTHPHPAKRSYASIDTTPGTLINIKAAALKKEKGKIPIPNDDFWQVVKHEKLGEGDFEVESSMSFGGSHWNSQNKHPHPPSPFYVKIDRPHEPAVDRQRETDIVRPPSPPIDQQAPLTYRVQLPSIDNDRIKALRPPPKPLANPPEPTTNPSDTTPEPMQVDEATEGRRLRKRKEKIPKNLKREANEKEMDGFTKRVLRIPVEKPFDEVYFTHRLWMFFRETKETEEDIRRMFHHVRERMKLRITLKKKSDPGKFAIPCVVKDSGFHESFAVETVIPSSNEDPTKEYDEDYWKERAIEITMHDDRYSSHSFNNTSPPSIDRVYSASVDTHPHPAKRSYASIDTTPGTLINIKAAALKKEKGKIPIPSRDPDGHARAMDGRILQVSREDITHILQVANVADNLFMQQRSIPDNIPAVPDKYPGADTT